MKIAAYIILVIATAVTAYFGFEHQRKFQELQAARFYAIDTNKVVTAKADKTEAERKAEQNTKRIAESLNKDLNATIEELVAKGRVLQREFTGLENDLKAQEEEFKELDKAMARIQEILKDMGNDVTLDNIGEKINTVQEDKKKKQIILDELLTTISTAEKKLAGLTAELERLVKKDLERNTNIHRNAMEAVINSVDQDWGFVVIGAGTNQGFAPQTTLIIKRDGLVIGRLKPSAIEPTQTIAEIDFSSLAPGVRIQPGDRVMPLKPITR